LFPKLEGACAPMLQTCTCS